MRLHGIGDMRQRPNLRPVEQPSVVVILAALILLLVACAILVTVLEGRASPALLSILALIVVSAAGVVRRHNRRTPFRPRSANRRLGRINAAKCSRGVVNG